MKSRKLTPPHAKTQVQKDKTKYDRKRIPQPEKIFQPYNGGKGG